MLSPYGAPRNASATAGASVRDRIDRSAAPITILLIVLTLLRIVTELAKEDVLDRLTNATINKASSRFAHLVLPGVLLVLSTALLVVLSTAESKEQTLLIPVALAAVALPSMIRAIGTPANTEVRDCTFDGVTPIPQVLQRPPDARRCPRSE